MYDMVGVCEGCGGCGCVLVIFNKYVVIVFEESLNLKDFIFKVYFKSEKSWYDYVFFIEYFLSYLLRYRIEEI